MRVRAGWLGLALLYTGPARKPFRVEYPVTPCDASTASAAHAEAVATFTAQHHLSREDIDIVGFHGQTVLHRPAQKMTVQIGDATALAKAIHIPVMHDFRAADVAAGGQGAPFVPVYHRALAQSLEREGPMVVLNIGGVSNITYIDGGDILITEIPGAWITRVTRHGKVVWSAQAPNVHYPSDAYPTRDGQVIVADYWKPGRVVIFNPSTRKITWEYSVANGEGMLDHPSLAMELPNGDVILNDDLRHRVLVIDRNTKQIIWQYGVTDQPGHQPGFGPNKLCGESPKISGE